MKRIAGTAILGQLTAQQDYDYESGSAGALLKTTNRQRNSSE
jgi:hypothetical protein